MTASATAAAVIVALAAPWVVERLRARTQQRRTPVLTLRLDPVDLVIEQVVYTDGVEGDAAWVRLGVSNEPGHDAARDVEVLLESARPLDGDDAPVLIAYPAVPWTHVGDTTRVTIPPGAT